MKEPRTNPARDRAGRQVSQPLQNKNGSNSPGKLKRKERGGGMPLVVSAKLESRVGINRPNERF